MNKETKDDSTNKTFIYYEMYKNGFTLTDIARHFGRSINTIKTHIRYHPKYEDPRSGNRLTKDRRNTATKSKSKNDKTKQLSFYCPEILLDRIKLTPGIKLKDRYIKAFEQYLKLSFKKRSDPKLKSTSSDKKINFLCPQKLVDKLDKPNLDRIKKIGDDLSRSHKIIAALELFCESNNV
ncbi:hypothetical protein [Pleurocapsa sp. FMAR1]|uniref:hypothetical protein n=1 Tax=Pleurocapsa sp. FMAR1 TaxID=3040204 RepID=UPI0029C92B28|nr:hypothetical protein [Pleurocapsa sp. FMAR1]